MRLGIWAETCPHWDSSAIHRRSWPSQVPTNSHSGPMVPIPFIYGQSLPMKNEKLLKKNRSSWDMTCSCGRDEKKIKQWKWQEQTENPDKKWLQIEEARPELDNIKNLRKLTNNPDKKLIPTVVRSVCIEAQAHISRDINIFVIGFITEDNCMAVCDIAEEIDSCIITYTSSKCGDSTKTTST